MTNLAEQIMQKIKNERLTPISFWHFRLARGLGWLIVLFSTILAIFFTAFALHIIFEFDWGAFGYIAENRYQAVFFSLPFLWIGFVVLFLLLSIHFSRRTRHGYRYAVPRLILSFLVISAGGGYAMEKTPYHEPVERFFVGVIPENQALSQLIPTPERQWAQPERGLLGGSITTLDQENRTFEIEDREEKAWHVEYQNARIDAVVTLEPRARVNIVGEQESENRFQADVIRQPKTSSKSPEDGDFEKKKYPQGELDGEDQEKDRERGEEGAPDRDSENEERETSKTDEPRLEENKEE